jgi:hypothetical protein
MEVRTPVTIIVTDKRSSATAEAWDGRQPSDETAGSSHTVCKTRFAHAELAKVQPFGSSVHGDTASFCLQGCATIVLADIPRSLAHGDAVGYRPLIPTIRKLQMRSNVFGSPTDSREFGGWRDCSR